jgi:RNA polymerase sigma-70 factor (ECF subfamily)
MTRGERTDASRAAQARIAAGAFEQHRRALRYHCYQLLGSLTDAEDVVQDTISRALVSGDRFERRADLKTWLFRIATNACIDELRRRKRRRLVSTARANGPFDEALEDHELDRWIQPFPDALLPSQRLARMEAVTLAFVAALQWLPARQRAVLVLRDSLGWSAEEVADLLGMTATAVHSALVRARATMAARTERRISGPEHLPTARRLAVALERRDVETLAALLRDDVVVHMPPWALWFDRRGAFIEFLKVQILTRDLRVTVTRANRRLALTMHDGPSPFAINVLALDRAHRLARMDAFVMPAVAKYFE